MGKKATWLGVVKRALSPDCGPKKKKEDDQQTTPKPPKTRWCFGKSRTADLVPDPPTEEPSDPPPAAGPPPPTRPEPPQPQAQAPPPAEEVKLTAAEREQNKHVYSVALATAEAAVAAAHAAAEAVRLTSAMAAGFSGVTKEELAAVKIQTAFRGFLARRALRALRGLVRLKSLMSSNATKRQSASTLQYVQTLGRIQTEIRARRVRMNEETQALQRHLQLKRERELEALKILDEDWDDTLQSKEQIETSLMNKYEAAIRRERAMAYAFSHQWKANSRSVNPTFIDPNNPQWGWSWMERWMAVKTGEKEVRKSDQASVRSNTTGIGGEIAKAYARRHSTNRPGSGQSTPQSKAPSSAGKFRSASPRGSGWAPSEDGDSRSMFSVQSERCRRHSIAGSSVRDDESLASSPAIPNYMTPTESARAKSRLRSPSSVDSKKSTTTPDRVSVGSAKKRLSFPAVDRPGFPSPVGHRRHSGPPKIDTSSVRSSSTVVSEQAVNNDRVKT